MILPWGRGGGLGELRTVKRARPKKVLRGDQQQAKAWKGHQEEGEGGTFMQGIKFASGRRGGGGFLTEIRGAWKGGGKAQVPMGKGLSPAGVLSAFPRTRVEVLSLFLSEQLWVERLWLYVQDI